jgi:lipoprotein-anchoring transpeptidase ErfK/SrfK
MLTRRRFLASSALAMAAGPTLAQELVSAERPMIEDPGPLRLDIGPAAVQATMSLPPDMDGDFVIPERFRARVVQVAPGLVPNDIHIVPQSFNLYFILPGNYAIRYGVAVGQEGLGWRGQAVIGRKVVWPSWRPTDEMIARNPSRYAKYADGMPGGPDTPWARGRSTSTRGTGTRPSASTARSSPPRSGRGPRTAASGCTTAM